MEWSDTHQAVMEALATIPGLAPTDVMPDVPVAGAAWPVWTGTEQTAGKLARPIARSYTIVVILPAGNHTTAVDQADGLDEQLIYAMTKAGRLTGPVVPTSVLFDNQRTMPGIQCPVTVPTR